MSKFLPTFPETSVSMGSLYVRHDLVDLSVTVYVKPWYLWDLDTQQVQVTTAVYHFVEPEGTLVGVKSFTIQDT